MRRGEIRHVNQAAAALGCRPGMSATACAEAMLAVAPFTGAAPVYEESRFLFRDHPGEPQVWGVDSASLLRPEDAGQIVFTASHGALLGGRPDSAISVPVLACAFNDAGLGIDDIGISRLPVLNERGIAAVTVDVRTARIGDVRSSWETGRISHYNGAAADVGMEIGMSLQDFAEAAIRHHLAART